MKQEIGKMVQDIIITLVKELTDWCAPIVVVPKRNEPIRLCVDYS